MNTPKTEHILKELESIDQFSTSKAYPSMLRKIKQLDRQKAQRRRYIMTSSIMSAAAVIMLVFWLQFNTVKIYNETNSPLTHILPDGSSVELNKYAELQYRRDMEKDRKVKLVGEAFFDIVKDAQHPFIIKAGKSKVKVLGTSFNVRHNKVSDKVEVLVKSGRVQLSNDDSYALELTASQYGIANDEQLKQVDQKDINYLAWKNRKLIFNDSELAYVIQTVEKSYHIDIKLSQEALSKLSLSTTFHQLELDEIMTSICLTLNLSQEKTADGYIISQK